MENERLEIVQSTMTQLLADGERSSKLFYEKLFELDPSARALFDDVEGQGMKFITTLGHIVVVLDKPEMMVGLVQKMGQDHVGYGVLAHHYSTMKEALLWTVAECLEEDFNPMIGAAWDEAYDIIATVMKPPN